MIKYLDLFAGSGAVAIGLGRDFHCEAAIDSDGSKLAWLKAHFPTTLTVCTKVESEPHNYRTPLVWASFPCKDTSVAGPRTGVSGARSGLYREAIRIAENNKAQVLCFENVMGLVQRNWGRDFKEIVADLDAAGWDCAAAVIDARLFVPQSRQRVFIVAAHRQRCPLRLRGLVTADAPSPDFHPKPLVRAASGSSCALLHLPPPRRAPVALDDVLEWDAPADKLGTTAHRLFVQSLSESSHDQYSKLLYSGEVHVATGFLRTRGGTPQMELRWDGVAGCIRTGGGGANRQHLLVVNGVETFNRVLTAREVARIMGFPDSYELPSAYNAALNVLGDAVCPPAVSWLARYGIRPLLQGS